MNSVTPETYLSDNFVVFDVETTSTHGRGLPIYGENRLVAASWCVGPDGPIHYRRGGEYKQPDLVAAVEAAEFVVCHNGKFDLGWLDRCGGRSRLLYDTLLGEYVRAGGRRWPLDLESCAHRYDLDVTKYNVVSRMIKGNVCPSEIPANWLETYAKQDVSLTRDLFLAQRQLLSERGMLPVLFTRCLLTPVLLDIEQEGLMMDEHRLLDLYYQVEDDYNIAHQELLEFAPINWNSAPQRGVYIYETLGFAELTKYGKPVRTKGGGYATDQDTVSNLTARTQKQREFLDIYTGERAANSELSKYLRKFKACVEDSGGLLRAQFNQARTATHRLSSSGLDYSTQLQNLPRAYKPLFRAKRDGWLIGEADGSQLEFRVAVHLGRDQQGLRDITSGMDIHAYSAGIIGVSRQEAKAHTFKPLYGGKSGSVNERRYYQEFRDRYKGITRQQQEWIDSVLARGYLTTEYGLRYYFSGVRMESDGYVKNSTNVCNYPVQGFATAEIIPIALWRMHKRIEECGAQMRIVNTVHDSIIAEIPPDEVDLFKEIARLSLIDDVYKYLENVYDLKLTVPLGCGIKIAEHWGDTDEEETFEAPRELYHPMVV